MIILLCGLLRNKQLRTNYLYEYTHELDLLYQQLFRALIGGGGGGCIFCETNLCMFCQTNFFLHNIDFRKELVGLNTNICVLFCYKGSQRAKQVVNYDSE